MRSTAMVVILVAGCGGGGADSGALITVRAPDGPASAKRLEVVLADASQQRTAVSHQYVTPDGTVDTDALYFRQLDTAGEVIRIDELDGFVLQIAPNATQSQETSFIPFLIAHGEQNEITGIAAVLDETGEPIAVTVEDGQLLAYFADMTPLSNVGASAIGPGEVTVVQCLTEDQAAFFSGIAWQPAVGPQLRLLLPDPTDSETDGSKRDLDMDCDGAIAAAGDCDDLQDAFFDGAEELCDGRDTDCDRSGLEPIKCPLVGSPCGIGTDSGVAVCVERGGQAQEGTCTPPPSCQCGAGGPPPCNKCVLDFRAVDTMNQKPCAPAIGVLGLAQVCGASQFCNVEVVFDANSPWDALLSKDQNAAFSTKVTDVRDALFLLVKPRDPNMPVFPGMAGSSIGDVYLHIDNGTSTSQMGIDLELTLAGATDSCPTSNGAITMQCGG